MNRFFILLMSFSLLLTACNDNKPKETTVVSGKDSEMALANEAEKIKAANQALEKKKDELSQLTPLSPDELKALIPESLMGAKNTSIDANSGSGAGMATGEYAINDSMSVVLTIIDCAGIGGVGIYNMQFQNMENTIQETEEEYTKSIDVNGKKGFEQCDKTSNDCTITYFAGNRYLVSLQGTKVGAPALREAVSQLRIK
jgi:hypothetical protein